jgi:hypothetical protein
VYDVIVTDEILSKSLLSATSQLVDALRDAQAALGNLIDGVAEVQARVTRGEGIDHIVRSSDAEEYRRVVDEGMEKFENWRRIARGSVIRAALAEGMTLTEVAEEFGFSRTYARRLARESADLPPAP